MKKPLTFALALMVLAVFADLGVAQQKAGEKPVEKPTQGKLPFVGKQQLMTGKVIQVNPTANTFTVMAKGQSVTFIAQAPGELTLLKVGQILDITYTETPGGGSMRATTINTSKSNTY